MPSNINYNSQELVYSSSIVLVFAWRQEYAHARVLFGSAEQTKMELFSSASNKAGELCLALLLIMDYVNYSIHCKSNEDFRQIALQNVPRRTHASPPVTSKYGLLRRLSLSAIIAQRSPSLSHYSLVDFAEFAPFYFVFFSIIKRLSPKNPKMSERTRWPEKTKITKYGKMETTTGPNECFY